MDTITAFGVSRGLGAMNAAVKEQLDALLKQAAEGSLSKTMQSVYSLLKDSGYMYRARVCSRFVGVHEANRDGMGVSPDHVHTLAESFHEMGFVASETRMMCLEIPAGDPDADRTRQFNVDLVTKSNNKYLASVSFLESFDHLCKSLQKAIKKRLPKQNTTI